VKLDFDLNRYCAEGGAWGEAGDTVLPEGFAAGSGPAAGSAAGAASSASGAVFLKIWGPYSVLASAAEPSLFYRRLKREKAQVHGELEKITLGLAGYIAGALSRGTRIISLAEPFGIPALLGESSYREYAASYLVRLLEALGEDPLARGLIHLCPHCSVPLEFFGYLKDAGTELPGRGSYPETLREYAAGEKLLLAGRRCVHTGENRSLRLFTIISP
jgi:hypothetical protein